MLFCSFSVGVYFLLKKKINQASFDYKISCANAKFIVPYLTPVRNMMILTVRQTLLHL